MEFLNADKFFTNRFNDAAWEIKNAGNIGLDRNNLLGNLEVEGCERGKPYQINPLQFGFSIDNIFNGEVSISIFITAMQNGESHITAIHCNCNCDQIIYKCRTPWTSEDRAISEAINRVYFAAFIDDMPGIIRS